MCSIEKGLRPEPAEFLCLRQRFARQDAPRAVVRDNEVRLISREELDLALAVIDEHTIAYCPDALDAASNAKIEAITDLDKILVDLDECTKGFACNLVSTGKHVIMSRQAPKLQAKLEARGLTCLTPDVTELKKGGGYIRCVSLWLD